MIDFSKNILEFETLDSTNNYLKQNCGQLPDGSVVTTANQTAGRGRGDHCWHDSGGMLAMSLLIKRRADKYSYTDISALTFAAAIAVSRAIEFLTPLSAGIKWTNDVIINKKKVCGILCESVPFCDSTEKYINVIAGIGINVTAEKSYFDSLGLPGATSLFAESGMVLPLAQVRDAVLSEFGKICSLPFSAIRSEYCERCISLGRNVSFSLNNVTINAAAVDIDEKGCLVCQNETGVYHVNAGEVHVEGLY